MNTDSFFRPDGKATALVMAGDAGEGENDGIHEDENRFGNETNTAEAFQP
jgi:hypothetical protein